MARLRVAVGDDGLDLGLAAVLLRLGLHAYPAAILGILAGSVWNFALSSRFWGRY